MDRLIFFASNQQEKTLLTVCLTGQKIPLFCKKLSWNCSWCGRPLSNPRPASAFVQVGQSGVTLPFQGPIVSTMSVSGPVCLASVSGAAEPLLGGGGGGTHIGGRLRGRTWVGSPHPPTRRPHLTPPGLCLHCRAKVSR